MVTLNPLTMFSLFLKGNWFLNFIEEKEDRLSESHEDRLKNASRTSPGTVEKEKPVTAVKSITLVVQDHQISADRTCLATVSNFFKVSLHRTCLATVSNFFKVSLHRTCLATVSNFFKVSLHRTCLATESNFFKVSLHRTCLL